MFEFFVQKKRKSGITLVETIVGITLLLIVFIGIFGLIRMSLKIISQSRARVIAAALANQKMELARNLTYNQVGTVGGIPNGSIPETENIVRNKISYTVKTTVIYIDDPFDGIFPADPFAQDYKRIRVRVSWSEFFGGQVIMQTDIAPKRIEGEQGGGTISILVFDASGQPVPQVDVHIENDAVFPPINVTYQTNNDGRLFVPGAPACDGCYKITANKYNYSSERTYAAGEQVRGVVLANPSKPYLSVIEGQLSEISFAIDRLSTKTINTIRYVEEKNWSDSFDNESKITEKTQVVIDPLNSEVRLEDTDGQYQASGDIVSITVIPTGLVEWGRLIWNDEISAATEIKYQIMYYNGTDWILIPDEDLTVGGIPNSEGLSDSPVDLSQLDAFKYKSVRLKAILSTTDSSQTPHLFDWQITWFSSDTTINLSNIPFFMQGTKTLGTNSSNQPIYKYFQNFTTDAQGMISIPNLEWDSYKITINGSTGFDIANSEPVQPLNLNPGADRNVIIKLANHQINTLLVTIEDSGGQPLVGATVRLYKTGYDKSKLTSNSGQVFFSPLTYATYNLEITMSGYQTWTGEVDVSGQSEQIILMTIP